jgi:pyrroloquinoline quinone biosynthesis protein B
VHRAARRPFAAYARWTAVLALAAIAPGRGAEAPLTPFVVVLGTAQDGGIPHLGGTAAPDVAARRDASARRLVSSLLVVDPASRKRWLVDATPDVAAQLELADRVAPPSPARRDRGGRPRILDGIFLTHAHVGHYLGLAWFGREIYGADRLPVHGSRRMTEFLAKNGPWELMVRLGQLELSTLEPERAVELAPGLALTPFLVPHRDEYTDTFGFEIRGPNRSLLFIPDIDKWEKWTTRIEDRLAKVDFALLDATFYGDGELPGRSMAEVPHPFVVESIARFAKLPLAERRKVVFTHLNHSNPAALANSPERAAIEAEGMRVAVEGERIDL